MNKLLLISVCCLLRVSLCKAQVFENDAAALEKHFIYEVKQIGEFFDRYNNDTNSFIRQVYRTKGVRYNVKRPALIKSLFDLVTHSWEVSLVDSFTEKALAVQMPSVENYYGRDWYAEISCLFEYNGGIITVPVILQIETDDKHGSKWQIAGIRQDYIRTSESSLAGSGSRDEKAFISPASNGNDFIQLQKVFEDKEHLRSYFNSTVLKNPQCISFYNAIENDQVKFVKVKQIRYHFLQVRDYVFTVEYFGREQLNSGWLISELREQGNSEKEKFRRSLLGEQ